MRTTPLLFLLTLSVVVCGCKGTEPEPATATTITWFEESGLFAGTTTVGFEEAKPIYANYPEYPKTTVFWDIHGSTGSAPCPDPFAYHVAWSSAVQKLALLTLKGVYTIDLKSGAVERIWHRDFLKPPWAVHASGRFILATGHDIDRNSDFFAAIDVQRRSASVHHIHDTVTGMVFTDDDTALVSTDSALLAIRHDDQKGWTFGLTAGHHASGRIVGAVRERPVYIVNNNTIACEEHHAEVAGSIRTVAVVDDVILVITSGGDIYRIDTNWGPRKVASFEAERVIGTGVFSSGLWIAVKGGRVHMFNSNGRETVYDIQIPQASSELDG